MRRRRKIEAEFKRVVEDQTFSSLKDKITRCDDPETLRMLALTLLVILSKAVSAP